MVTIIIGDATMINFPGAIIDKEIIPMICTMEGDGELRDSFFLSNIVQIQH